MANPVVLDITKNAVTLVATGVTTGWINKHWLEKRDIFYYATYRTNGDPAPTFSEMKLEMKKIFIKDPEQEEIKGSAAIDVYLIAAREDGTSETGKVIINV